MKKVVFLPSLALSVALLATGCSTYNAVNSTSADGVDFKASYKTYRWLADKTDTLNTAYNNQILRNNLRMAIDRELAARRMHLAPEGATADLSLQLVVQSAGRSRDYGRFQPAFYFGPFGGSYNTSRSYYTHNSLTLNAFDAKTSQLVWTCTAEGDLDKAKQANRGIQPAVEKMMKKYPVQPLKKAA